MTGILIGLVVGVMAGGWSELRRGPKVYRVDSARLALALKRKAVGNEH